MDLGMWFPIANKKKDKYHAGIYKQGSCRLSNSVCCQLSLVGVGSVGWDGGRIIFVHYIGA